MIADGVLEHPKATRSLSMHVSSKDRTGTVLMTDGPTMAIADKFEIIVHCRTTRRPTTGPIPSSSAPRL